MPAQDTEAETATMEGTVLPGKMLKELQLSWQIQ